MQSSRALQALRTNPSPSHPEQETTAIISALLNSYYAPVFDCSTQPDIVLKRFSLLTDDADEQDADGELGRRLREDTPSPESR
ncbi:uncharacterized [Tachysurus ichikawai]